MKASIMPRQSIHDLEMPPKGYRPNKAAPDAGGRPRFETLAEKRREDDVRIRMIKRAVATDGLSDAERSAAHALSARLESARERGKIPRTFASAAGARKMRMHPLGWLHYLHDQELERPGGRVSTFTVFPPLGWRVASEDLAGVEPAKLFEQFRSHLSRQKDAPADDGWLFAGLHGEYGEDGNVGGFFDLHLHGVVAGSIIERLEALRRTKTFGPGIHDRTKSAIQIEQVQLRDPLIAIGYCMQSWWPWRSYLNPQTLTLDRMSRRRIPEPHHTRMLLWLNQYKLKHLTKLIGLEVRSKQLIRTRAAYINDEVIKQESAH